MASLPQPDFMPPKPARRDMVWLAGGDFTMGSDRHYPEERPSRRAAVEGFWIDRSPVTNRRFGRFVRMTGYRTLAELAGASLVFTSPKRPTNLHGPSGHYWSLTGGADWMHPCGPGSGLVGLADHPVVHVALADIQAYCAWADAELPSEAEWEYAARGGLHDAEYAWGDRFLIDGEYRANTWQGNFPFTNTVEDGWRTTSVVGSFPANGFGLYDMIGNVWEWTADSWTAPEPLAGASCCEVARPDAGSLQHNVLKGGSFLCAPGHCRRYRPAARRRHASDTSASHIGFRCVIRA